MPIGRFHGDHPTITGDRQVPQLMVSKAEAAPLQVNRWARNGKNVDAWYTSAMGEALVAWSLYRSKECFGMCMPLGNGVGTVSAAGTQPQWRFAMHTSPLHGMLLARAAMHPQTTFFNYNSYATLKIYSDATETTLVATESFYYGGNPLNTNGIVGWQYMKFIDKQITGLSPDTTYFCVVSNVDYGLIQSLAVAEINSLTSNDNGYPATNVTSETIITDRMRENLVRLIPSLWKRGGAKLLNWTARTQTSPDPRTITSSTPTNLIDGTSTTYGSSIPGFTLDMTGKARLSQASGVPFRMHVWGKNTTDGKGRVYLKDSAGVTICSITDGWSTGTGAWQTTTGVLPATAGQKVYLVYDDNGSAGVFAGSFTVGAVTCYQYEA